MRSSLQLQGDESWLFEQYSARLERIVASQVGAPEAVIEDACANAWLILLRRQPQRNTVWSWLKVVAIREAWRLAGAERRAIPLNDALASDLATAGELEERVEFYEELASLEYEVDARQRRLLLLHAAGFKYTEIAAITGDSVRTVERQLLRTRQRLRATR